MTSRSSKTLSNGTLSLRFMQNAALRSKQQAKVEPERAEIYDDGKWEVSQAVKDAWGGADADSSNVTYETSYLPFLFPSSSDQEEEEEDESKLAVRPTKIQGRRVFGKKGKEIVYQDQAGGEGHGGAGDSTSKPDSPEQTQKSRAHPNPRPISYSAGKLLSGLQEPGISNTATPKKKGTKPTVTSISGAHTTSMSKLTAREAIYNLQGTGTDLRQANQLQKPSTGPTPTASIGFLKPSGVDDPNELKPVVQVSSSSSSTQPQTQTQNPGPSASSHLVSTSTPTTTATISTTTVTATSTTTTLATPGETPTFGTSTQPVDDNQEIIQGARAKPKPKAKAKAKPTKKAKREREGGSEDEEDANEAPEAGNTGTGTGDATAPAGGDKPARKRVRKRKKNAAGATTDGE